MVKGDRVWGVKGLWSGLDSLTEQSKLWLVPVYRIRDIYRVQKWQEDVPVRSERDQ